MNRNAMLKTLCIVGVICGVAVLQASAVVASLPATDERPSKGPTLLSDGLVTTGVDESDLLRAFRDAIVNEKLLQINKKPFYLTSAEKTSPGGGALAVSTEPNDSGFLFTITAYPSVPAAGIPASLDIRTRCAQKRGVAEDELARRIAKLNAEKRFKIYAVDNAIVIQISVYLPEVTTWDYVGRVTSSYLLGAGFLAVENAKTSSPIVEVN